MTEQMREPNLEQISDVFFKAHEWHPDELRQYFWLRYPDKQAWVLYFADTKNAYIELKPGNDRELS